MYNLVETFELEDTRAILFKAQDLPSRISEIHLHHDDGSSIKLNDFAFAHFTQCFSEKQNQGFSTKTKVPEKYLHQGTKIELITAH